MEFTITFTIPENKVAAIRDGYLAAKPIPQEPSDPNDPNSPLVDTTNAKNWILKNAKDAAMEHIRLTYNRGRDQLERQARIQIKDIVGKANVLNAV